MHHVCSLFGVGDPNEVGGVACAREVGEAHFLGQGTTKALPAYIKLVDFEAFSAQQF